MLVHILDVFGFQIFYNKTLALFKQKLPNWE